MAKKILFVDDDEDMRFVIKLLLKEAGYRVELHSDAGFVKSKHYPDLYLLDRHMDGTDLFDICRSLKANPATKHIPVIMFSADPKIKDEYSQCSADGYIEKPFDIPHFLDKIASFLK